MKRRLLLLTYVLVISSAIYAQTYTQEILKISSGLSQNSALAIIQDSKGFIWIGTKDGLNRFDGVNCKVYRYEANKNSLINNYITCLYLGTDGNIWIGTYNGLDKFNPKNEKFFQYKKVLTDSVDPACNAVTSILEDNNKKVWVGTKEGLYKLTVLNNKLINDSNNAGIFKELDKKAISCLYKDKEKNIWIGTSSNGLYCYSEYKNSIKHFFIDHFHTNGGKVNNITSIVELSDKKMIVGTSGNGAFTFDKDKERFTKCSPLLNVNNKNYNYVTQIKNTAKGCYVLTNRRLYLITKTGNSTLWRNDIVPAPTTFLIDNSGIIWIGSDGGGIVKLKPFRKKFNTVTKENYAKNGFSFSSIRAILKVKGNLFIGGYTGLLEAKNYNSNKPSVWKNIKLFNRKNVYSMTIDPTDKNILWIGTEDTGLFKYNIKTGAYEKFINNIHPGKYNFLSNSVFDILVCRNNDIYFGTSNGTAKYNYKKKSFTNFIYSPENPNTVNSGYVMALCEDKNGNIWMGTNQSGISIYNPKTNSFLRLESRGGINSSLSNNQVNVIFEDHGKNIWVGTAGGLNKFSYAKNNFKVYTTRNGLPNDYVYGILEDKTGCLWLSTNKGISKFNPKDGTFTNYDESYGLQSNEFNTAAYYKSDEGEMFFGGIKGFTSFYPAEILQNTYAPPVIITNLKKFNLPAKLDSSISYINEIELPYNDYFFSFDFVMPEYSNSSHCTFAYKLSGLDERWITLTNGERTAAFTVVPPGEYTLVVKGANSDGTWSAKETKLKIVIQPAYWNTWWFRLLYIGFFIMIIFFLYSSRVNRLKKEKEIQRDLTKKLMNSQEEERKNISSELHDDLGQNLLVVKNRLMLADRDKNLEESINDVLEILDSSIHDVSNISHLLHPSELEELGLTQAIESMIDRIKSASNLKIINNLFNIDEYFSSEEKINVFRIIQEALNNIIKHAHATEVVISCDVKRNNLSISITDNGIGFTNSTLPGKNQRPHIGLKGMKERVLLLKGVLAVNSPPNKGTTIRLEFKNRIKT